MRLGPNNFDGQASGRPHRSFSLIMFLAAVLGIFGHTHVKRGIGAAQDVAKMHFALRLRSGQNFASRNFGGGGSRTPVREALPPEDYMLSPFRVRLAGKGKPRVSPTTLRAGKTRRRLVR